MAATVLLADDHPIVRQGLRNLLEVESDFLVVGEAEDGKQAIQLGESLRPNIMIVDMTMPYFNGLEVIRQLSKKLPNTHFIMLSMQSANPYVVESLEAGADGYVLKDSGPEELVHAIREVLNGKVYLSPKLIEHMPGKFISRTKGRVLNPTALLTKREGEIMQLTCEGLTGPEIGKILSISPRTVETHRQNLMRKLGVTNIAELIHFVIEHGLFSE